MPIAESLLLVFASVGVFYDVKEYRIPNCLIVIGLISGFAFGVLHEQGFFPYKSAIGIASAGILLPLWAGRILGAGDIKLFAVIGSFLGAKEALACMLYAFLAEGVIAFAVLMKRKHFRLYLRNLLKKFILFIQTGIWTSNGLKKIEGKEDNGRYLHFSIGIFLGILRVLLFTG